MEEFTADDARKVTEDNRRENYQKRLKKCLDTRYSWIINEIKSRAKDGHKSYKYDLYCDNYEKGEKCKKNYNYKHRINCMCSINYKDVLESLKPRLEKNKFIIGDVEYAHKYDDTGYIIIRW